MHPDMLLLAERLVIVMERMSEDVKNISTYMYDLSYNVSCFLKDKKEKEEGENLPSCPSTAGQEASVESQYSGQRGEASNDVEHEETSVGGVESKCFDHNDDADVLPSFTGGIHFERQPESEEIGEASGVCNILDNSRSNVRETSHPVVKEEPGRELSELFNVNNWQPQIQHHTSCRPQIASSSTQLVSGETPAMIIQKQLSSELGSAPLAILECHKEVGAASCSTNEGGAQRLKVFVEQQVSGERWMPHINHSEGRGYNNNEETCSQYETPPPSLLRRSIGVKPFRCSLCGKTFKRQDHFSSHMRIHSAEKLYMCSECGKALKSRLSLRNHLRTHTGEKPYRCTQCEKSFTNCNSLTVHIRQHTGDWPYKCSVCGKCFIQSSHLSRHYASKH